jgi:hypothetical protein
MTLRTVDLTAVTLPRGTWAVQSYVDTVARFRFVGETADLSLPAGLVVAVGGLALGTVEAAAATIDALVCHLRF